MRPSGEQSQFANSEAGVTELVSRLQPLAPHLIVMEATGGLELLATAALAAAGLRVSVVNPRQVRDFAKAVGQLAKTDAPDALVLARFAAVVQPSSRPVSDAKAQAFATLLARRQRVVTMLTAGRLRLGTSRRRPLPHRGPPRLAAARTGGA